MFASSKYYSSLLICVSSALRIEWCRSRARAMRWSEEVLWLREEMRRVLGSRMACPLVGRPSTVGDLDISLKPELLKVTCYAPKQADIRDQSIRHSTVFGGVPAILVAWESERTTIFCLQDPATTNFSTYPSQDFDYYLALPHPFGLLVSS